MKHQLTDVNTDNRTAICVYCEGLVRIYRKSNDKWYCTTKGVRFGTSRPRHTLNEVDVDCRTAICNLCGPIRIRLSKTTGKWYCGGVVERPFHQQSKINADERAICTACGEDKQRTEFYLRSDGVYKNQRSICIDCHKDKSRQRRYGLTSEQIETKFASQGGICPICKRKPIKDERQWPIDHNKKTGQVRDILCHACNPRLGHIEDKEFLIPAIEYLRRWSE